MQEIIQNIGIRLQKDTSKKGLSIIDKLKDKMKTNMVAVSNETDSSATLNSPNKTPINSVDSVTSTSSQNNITELPKNSETPSIVESEKNISSSEETSNNKQPDDCNSQTQSSSRIDCDSQSISEENPTSKVKDPLATLDQKKNDESDAEISDNTNIKDTASMYDSDSSSEQSDSEMPTDVNMILKETSNINASSKDPMLTTIQRLAAQLQATKPLETCKDEAYSKSEGSKEASPFGSIPKPPDVVPISNIKKFVGKMENKFHEISHESHDDNPPKNFIRLRRLSGDILSVPIQPLDVQEESLSKTSMYACNIKVIFYLIDLIGSILSNRSRS